MIIRKLGILILIFVGSPSYASEQLSQEAQHYIQEFANVVMANCNLQRLMCGNEKVKLTSEQTDNRAGYEQTYRMYEGDGIELKSIMARTLSLSKIAISRFRMG